MGLILPQTVNLKWNGRNKQHYVNKGYVFTKMKDEFEVNVQDLTSSSSARVKVVCDICGEILNVAYRNFFKHNLKNEKYYCVKCSSEERQQTCKERYGAENPFQSKEIQDKCKQTCKERYGVENPFQVKEIQDKFKKTCEQRYGKSHPSQVEKFKEKKKQTCKKNYGKEYPSQVEEIKNKIKKTTFERHGVSCVLQLKEIRKKGQQKMLEQYGSEYGKYKVCGSKSQLRIYNLVGGMYNYPFHGFFL